MKNHLSLHDLQFQSTAAFRQQENFALHLAVEKKNGSKFVTENFCQFVKNIFLFPEIPLQLMLGYLGKKRMNFRNSCKFLLLTDLPPDPVQGSLKILRDLCFVLPTCIICLILCVPFLWTFDMIANIVIFSSEHIGKSPQSYSKWRKQWSRSGWRNMLQKPPQVFFVC